MLDQSYKNHPVIQAPALILVDGLSSSHTLLSAHAQPESLGMPKLSDGPILLASLSSCPWCLEG